MGGDLTYECLGSNQYKITLKVYRDCNGINAGSYEVIYATGNCGTGYQTMSKIGITEITPTCPGFTGSACGGGGGIYGVEEHIYETILTVPSTCTGITFYWRRCCRNGAINTLSSPLSERMYIKTIIPDASVCNKSPIFLNNPVPFICVNQPVFYNHGAVDPDGDDLSFSLVPCLNNNSLSVSYSSGFSATNPLTTSTGITIDATTGALEFTPTATQVGVLCVLVEEYRNGVKISEIVRDIQFTIVACSNNNPTATGINNSATFSTSLSVGTNLCFDIFSNDIDAGDIVIIDWNAGISGSTFTIDNSGSFPKGTFCWTPTVNDIGTNIFTVIVTDDNCPLVGLNTYTYSIEVSTTTVQSVTDGDWSTPSTWDCNCLPTSAHNIIIDHNVTLGLDFTVNNGSYLEVNGSIDISSGYDLRIEGVFNNYNIITGAGNLILAGSSAKFVRLGDVENVEISNTEGILIASNSVINRKLKLTTGYLNSNGYDLVLKSDAHGTALVEDNGGSLLGDLIVQRFLQNINGHHFLSSPVADATINELADDIQLALSSSFPNIYYYDETNTSPDYMDGWISPTSTAHLMGAGEGFTAWFNSVSGITLDIVGNLNTGSINVPLTYTTNSSTGNSLLPPPEGWNFVGNPYASPIDFELVLLSAPIEIESALYYWDPVSQSYFNYIDGVASPSTTSQIIPSGQGFWVRVTGATTINFSNSHRITDPDQATNPFLKSSTSSDPIFRIEINGQGHKEEILTRFKLGATPAFDSKYDAYYILSGYPGSIDFAALTNDGPVKINSLPPLPSSNLIIPLFYAVSITGNYSISMTEFNYFGSNDQIMLEDTKLGINHILNSGPYNFHGNLTDSIGRFNIHVMPAVVSSTNQLDQQDKLKIYKCVDALCISLAEVNEDSKQLRIYNALGQEVYTTRLQEGQQEYQLNNINLPSPNVYFIDIESLEQSVKIRW